jgi:hypothetical protein
MCRQADIGLQANFLAGQKIVRGVIRSLSPSSPAQGCWNLDWGFLSVHNWCLQPPHGASLLARTNHAIMTEVHSSCDANLGTSMMTQSLAGSHF